MGAALTVRGLPGVAAAPKEAVGATERISWTEAGGAVDAVARGMSRDEALAVLRVVHLRTSHVSTASTWERCRCSASSW